VKLAVIAGLLVGLALFDASNPGALIDAFDSGGISAGT
jgi:hypothetical protein